MCLSYTDDLETAKTKYDQTKSELDDTLAEINEIS